MADDRAVRWLDGTAVRSLVLHVAHDRHAFHEDAKPGDLTRQLGTRSFNSSNQLVTRMSRCAPKADSDWTARTRSPSGWRSQYSGM